MTTLLWVVTLEAFLFISTSVSVTHTYTYTPIPKTDGLTHGQQPFSMDGQATFGALWNLTFIASIQPALEKKSNP